MVFECHFSDDNGDNEDDDDGVGQELVRYDIQLGNWEVIPVQKYPQ